MLLSNLVVSYGTTGGSKQALLSNLVVPPGTTGSREATVYIGIVHRGGFFEVSTQYDTNSYTLNFAILKLSTNSALGKSADNLNLV